MSALEILRDIGIWWALSLALCKAIDSALKRNNP